ncbi:hypothetical protein [Mesorhizobium sp. CAU 1741]|uniref:hypothetical protein n=1 Tax=Mesorhizobium sp. CAU 1741 TaxID=3140366 RepID=UPI00325AEE50
MGSFDSAIIIAFEFYPSTLREQMKNALFSARYVHFWKSPENTAIRPDEIAAAAQAGRGFAVFMP